MQGASTIEQQFIKNALQAQSHRTIFEKLREAALAYQLSHKWSKDKIVTAYLNTIYFGNGAYGIEAGGADLLRPRRQPRRLRHARPRAVRAAAAAVGGRAARRHHPIADAPMTRRRTRSRRAQRRNMVLHQMLEQGYLTRPVYDAERHAGAARAHTTSRRRREQTVEGVDAGYFTSWVQQQVIERYGAARAFDGGLHIKTTLDLDLQHAAEQAVNAYLAYPGGPTASLVAIENSTGEVRAMVGGRDYNESPFNLATEGERQPGSSFKAFDLAAALEAGISPDSVWTLEAEDVHRAQHARPGKVRRPQRRRRLLGLEHADRRDRLLGQLDLRRSRPEGRHRTRSRCSPTGWASRRRCRPTRR